LDAEAKYNQFESATIDYLNSGAELPEHAARVRPSDAGMDGSFNRIDENNRAMALQNAYETAKDSLDSNNRAKASHMRTETLSAQHGPDMLNPVIQAHHESLSETGVSHFIFWCPLCPHTQPPRPTSRLCGRRSAAGPGVPEL
jgi:hypothetical protein